ncbi:MAG: hypothetical protein NCW75_09670 [Phycisphaera sp.]|nr:MAG: hypothetical protein NCW75_09670 [Phycisphaera sp.]
MTLAEVAIWGALGGFCLEAMRLSIKHSKESEADFRRLLRSRVYWFLTALNIAVAAIVAAALQQKIGDDRVFAFASGVSARTIMQELQKYAAYRLGPPQGDGLSLRRIVD